jgi:acyl-CoA thioester hydrolase
MENYSMEVQVRWSDFDPNFHLLHSVYYDWGAMCRVEFLNRFGFTADIMKQNDLGPILLREEAIFRREIRPGDKVTIDLKALKAKKDFSRFTFQHEIKKNGDTLSAILTVDIAWINTVKRKLTSLPEHLQEIFHEVPKAENFEWLD